MHPDGSSDASSCDEQVWHLQWQQRWLGHPVEHAYKHSDSPSCDGKMCTYKGNTITRGIRISTQIAQANREKDVHRRARISVVPNQVTQALSWTWCIFILWASAARLGGSRSSRSWMARLINMRQLSKALADHSLWRITLFMVRHSCSHLAVAPPPRTRRQTVHPHTGKRNCGIPPHHRRACAAERCGCACI